MFQTAQLVVEAALMRRESRGGHYRAGLSARETWMERAPHRALSVVGYIPPTP